jgi:iron-sulfur cluster repair protein YtfE (RIC family)
MLNADAGHHSCASKPLHRVVARLERDAYQPLRTELPLIVQLAQDAVSRSNRRQRDLLPQVHLAACLLMDAALAHFDRDEALLFPSVRLIEDGAGARALDLHQLVPELRQEHTQIRALIAQLRLMTHDFIPPMSSPMLRTLFAALSGVARDLEAAFQVEHRSVFPQALSLQHGRPLRPEV